MRFKLIWLFIIGVLALSHSNAAAKSLEEIYKTVSSLNPEDRILKATKTFINTATGLNPLGEATGVDPHPLISASKFDCTTYVETNLALAFAKSAAEILPVLTRIRYSGEEPNYFQRNHFMISDWIPSNSKKGFVLDITNTLTADKVAFKLGDRTFNKTNWYFHRVIELLEQQKKSSKEILEILNRVPDVPEQKEKTIYLLADYFRSHAKVMQDALPELSIVMFLRNIPTTPSLITHMGFAIKRNGTLMLNHAPQAKPWKVQEVTLEDYFKDMDSHRAPIQGLIFLRIQDKR